MPNPVKRCVRVMLSDRTGSTHSTVVLREFAVAPKSFEPLSALQRKSAMDRHTESLTLFYQLLPFF